MTESRHLTVKALTQYLKRKFDVDPHLQQVSVIGEVSNFRLRANSHQYFSLKDESARISVVMYRHAFEKVPFDMTEGMKVVATGRVSLYEPSGAYQLTIERLEPDGIGALYLALEQLKQRFKAQGLLDLPKKCLPRFPKKIAVITSPSGAVIRDILTTIKRRYPIVQVTIFPTRVQGKEAVGEIVKAFEKVEYLRDEFDTVIVARGGGSIEDLWCFNEESVAQAIIRSTLPVIAAIGHETDTTLADLVADMRAPTPTAAAELAVPVLAEVVHLIQERERRLYQLMRHHLTLYQQRYQRLKQSYILQQPDRLYQPYIQQLDRTKERLYQLTVHQLQHKKYYVSSVNQQLLAIRPQIQIVQYRQRVLQVNERLKRAMRLFLQHQRQTVAHNLHLLDAYSPLKIMSRGYAIVEHQTRIVTSVDALSEGDFVHITLSDGQLEANIVKKIKKDRYYDNKENS